MLRYMKPLAILLVVSSILLSGCGTLLYPERTGQKRGSIDPAVAILDGVGVLLYVIPGLVAFAIDFHNGTIYLPSGRAKAFNDIDMPSHALDSISGRQNLNRFVSEEVGIPDIFNDRRLQISALESDR